MQVSVLCVSGRSIYHHLHGVDAYDQKRDCRQFAGRDPVIAHPPCRTWSKYLRHMAKPVSLVEEQKLAFFCLEKVLQNGGILEQPAGSRFWKAANLPLPNEPAEPFLYTVYVEQQWFGYCSRKPTWLLVSGIPRKELPELPFSFNANSSGTEGQSQFARSRTVRPFAEWMLKAARQSWWQLR